MLVGHGAGVLALEPLRPGAPWVALWNGRSQTSACHGLSGEWSSRWTTGRLFGFALSGEALADKNALTRELPPTLP